MILVWVCAAWASDPEVRRAETRLAAMAVARTQGRVWTGDGIQIGIAQQLPTPFVLGLDVVAGFDRTPTYDLDFGGSVTITREPQLWIDLIPYAGYTVRVGRIDATPELRWSAEAEALQVAAALRWWWGDHWSLQGQFGPRTFSETYDGRLDVGLGVAWRGQLPDLTE
jgi:hypothetical protein